MLLDQLRRAVPLRMKTGVTDLLLSDAVGKLIRRLVPGPIPHHGCKISLPEDAPAGTAASLLFGFYERAELFMVRRFLPPDRDVVELGASIGVGTCQIARRAPARRVIAVEASARLAQHAQKNLSLNNIQNVAVVARALDYEGRERVRFGGRTSLDGKVSEEGDEEVPTTTLASLVEDHCIGRYTLVADIEGAEIPLLIHDREALARCDMIIIEMDGGHYRGAFYDADAVERLILSNGFCRIYRHGPCATFVRSAPGIAESAAAISNVAGDGGA